MLKIGSYHPMDPSISAWDEKGQANISQIFIWHGSFIDSLQFQYVDDDGNLVLSPIFGCPNPKSLHFDTVTFTNPPKEYITRVSGSKSTIGYKRGVTTLTIETNEATYGPFGSQRFDGDLFNYWFGPLNQFGGFHGTSSSEHIITSIGVYVQPIQDLGAFSKKTELLIN